MFTERFLKNRRTVELTIAEYQRLEESIIEIKALPPRKTIVNAGDRLHHSLLLTEGFMCRYIDDRNGLRQLVAVQVPGDFLDLHGYPLKRLDHDVATITGAKVAVVPHTALDAINADDPVLTKKLWFSTLLDAAMHRAWLFRLGRLDAVGRVAHFLSETNIRLAAVGLSDGRRFDFGLTQSDLAEICGLTSVHVNRVMRNLREEGLCVFRSSAVDIIDPLSLARRGEFDPAYLYLADPPLVALRPAESNAT